MKILIIGHSHTTSLSNAAKQMNVSHQVVRLDREIVLKDLRQAVVRAVSALCGAEVRDEDLGNVIEKEGIRTIATVGGNFHNVVGLLKHNSPYDFVVPGYENLPLETSRDFIQFDAISDLFYTHLRRMFLGILDIRRVVGVGLVHIDSPPPPEDNGYIRNNIDEYFKQLFPDGIPEINTPVIRFKHWQLAQMLYERFCNDAAIRFLRNDLPRRNEYYLKEEYFGDDSTHANAEFSKFYIKSVIES